MLRKIALCAVLIALVGVWPGLPVDGGAAAVPDSPAAQTDHAAEGSEATRTGEEGEHGSGEEPSGEHDGGEHGEGEHGGGHGGPVIPVLFGLAIILAAAKLGGELFERIDQPAVLGELILGILLGNLTLLGFSGLDFIATNTGIEILAQIGVILLLFEVGLESNVREMLSVGLSSFAVAVLGIIAPFFLGWGVSAWLLPDEHVLVHAFIGATLCATSVGITARVLTDLGKIQTREAKVILGAAVIDDILGLIILAVVQGVITAADSGGELASLDILMILVKAVIFLFGAILVGSWLSPRVFRLASRLRIRGMLLTVALCFVFLLSFLADYFGLAAIVGAFAAGLILDEVHYKDFRDRGEHTIEELLHPIATFMVPVFFVWIGARVDLSAFGQVEILGFAALLSVAAVLGKMICVGGVLERGMDRISVAVGMVPRGEVGLIFAGIGASLMLDGERVISPSVFGAVVIMVIVTTLITPPALKLTLGRWDRKQAAERAGEPETVGQ